MTVTDWLANVKTLSKKSTDVESGGDEKISSDSRVDWALTVVGVDVELKVVFVEGVELVKSSSIV